MSQTMNTTVNRTIVKMYKKTNCIYCDFLPSVEIANTPEQIEEQIIKFNAVVDATIDFIAFPETDINASEEDDMPVYISKSYSTKVDGNCQDGCKATYCLLIVEMTEEMNRCEMAGEPSFYITKVSMHKYDLE